MSDLPPPYIPHPPPPTAPSFPSALSTQPSAFPGSPYQTFPQTCGGNHSYFQGPQGSSGGYMTQPGYQGYHSGSPGTAHPYGEQPKHTVYVVEQNRGGGDGGGGGGGEDSCLAACSAALCCCCLWNMLTDHLC